MVEYYSRVQRVASKNAREKWRHQLNLHFESDDDKNDVILEENNEEWLMHYDAVKSILEEKIQCRAMIWKQSLTPSRPLGRWAKGKVWVRSISMYV